MTCKSLGKEDEKSFGKGNIVLERNQEAINQSMKSTTSSKSFQVLRKLWENGKRKTVYCFDANQTDLARELNITRQTLSFHFRKLREAGLIQVGRNFINVTDDGLKAIGFNSNPVIVIVRISPPKRYEVLAKLQLEISLPAVETFIVTGDIDIVLVVQQERLDQVLGTLSAIDGIAEVKCFVSIETMVHPVRILIVDDDESVRKSLVAVLTRAGYVVDTAENGKEAIGKSEAAFYNLAIIDIRLPDMEGTKLLKEMKDTTPKMAKIILTGYPTLRNAIEAVNKGANAYLTKPVNMDDLLKIVREELAKQQQAVVPIPARTYVRK